MPLKTPICDFGQAAKSFELKSTNNEIIKLNDVKGTNGTLVMFICNHCPYVKAVIKGWSGLKYLYLEELLLVDVSALDSDDTLTFTQENAELLMRNSTEFDTWVTETVGDLENFTKNKSKSASDL